MARLHRKRSTAHDDAAVSHERGIGDDDVGVVRGWLDGGESEVFRFTFLERHLGVSNYILRIRGDDAIDAVEHVSRWRSRRVENGSIAVCDVWLGARAREGDAPF